MPRFPGDQAVENALLEGRVAVDDAPPGLQHVAGLVRAARAPASPEENAVGDRLAISCALARRSFGDNGLRPRLKAPPFWARSLSTKLVAATAVVGLGAGTAAGATGALPAPIQAALASSLAHIGISLPGPTSGARPNHTTPIPTNHGGDSTGTTGQVELCAHHGDPGVSSVLSALAQAQGETVQTYCQNVTSSTVTLPAQSQAPGSAGSPGSGNPSGPPNAPGQSGKNPAGPSVTAPGQVKKDTSGSTTTTPGQSGKNPAGPSVTAPGQVKKDSSGSTTTTPGQAGKNPAGPSVTAPGQVKKDTSGSSTIPPGNSHGH